MWSKLFVLLRLPISVIALLGFAELNVWNQPGMGLFGVMFVVGLLVFLAATSIKLVRRRRGALQLAGWLLAAEVLGAVSLIAAGDYIYMAAQRVDMGMLYGWGCTIIIVWTLPNAVILYSQRAKFAEPETNKPGL